MSPIRIVLAASCLTAAIVHAENETEAVLAGYQAAMAAYQAEAYETYAAELSGVLELVPGHPIIKRHLARAHVLRGDPENALAWLEQVATTGVDLGIESDEHFTDLHTVARFVDIVNDVTARKTPLGRSRLRHELSPSDFIPEGLAYDPVSGDLFIGSMRQRRIVRIHADGTTSELLGPDDGLMGVLGLRVDVKRRVLWACSGHIREMEGYDEAQAGRTSITKIDLDTSKVIRRFELSAEDTAHDFNDVAIASTGNAYITDALGGGIYTVDARNGFNHLLPPETLNGPNGIAVGPNDRYMYVSQYSIGLSIIDLETLDIRMLPHPADVVTVGIDGLYYHDGSLIGVQNMAGLDRVTRFHLTDDGRRIVSADVLDAHDPRLEDPTTGAIVGDSFVYIANSQLPKFDSDGNLPPVEEMDPTFILEVEL